MAGLGGSGTTVLGERSPWQCEGLSFDRIYELHADAVHAVARRTGVPHLAVDVTQDVFVRLWHEPHRFDPARGSLRTFLVMSARGLAIDKLRSETARANREQRSERSVPSPSDVDPVVAADTADEITAALSRLPDDCRAAIVAAFYGGLTYSEVAAAFGTPEGTVKSRIRRGLMELRRDLTRTSTFA